MNLLNTSDKIKYTEYMSFFVKNNNCNQHNDTGTTGPSAATQKFLAEFSTKVNDEAKSVELANVIAGKACLDKLGLVQWSGRDAGLWGLIIFCATQKYFFIPAAENRLFGFTRNGDDSSFPEQLISLSTLDGFSVQTKPHTFWSVIDSDRKHTLNCSFKDNDGAVHAFSIRTQHDAESVLVKLQSE